MARIKAGRVSAMEMLRGAIPQEAPMGVPGVHTVPIPAPAPVREPVPAMVRPRLRVAAIANA